MNIIIRQRTIIATTVMCGSLALAAVFGQGVASAAPPGQCSPTTPCSPGGSRGGDPGQRGAGVGPARFGGGQQGAGWGDRGGAPQNWGGQPAWGQHPNFGEQPASGRQPNFGQQPAWGQQPNFGQQPYLGQ